MIDGKGDGFADTRDGNLSSIISRIRDDGPAAPTAAPSREWVVDDAPPPATRAPRREATAPPRPAPAQPPLAGRSSPTAPAVHLQPAAIQPQPQPTLTPARPAPVPPPSGAPAPARAPAPVARPAAGRRFPGMALAVASAVLVTAGVLLALYRTPIEAAVPKAVPAAPVPDLREEIAAVQVAVAMLAERVETIAGDGESVRQVAAALDQRLERAARQAETVPSRGAEALERLEGRLGELGDRVDAVAQQLARLAAEAPAERAAAAGVPVAASASPQDPPTAKTAPAPARLDKAADAAPPPASAADAPRTASPEPAPAVPAAQAASAVQAPEAPAALAAVPRTPAPADDSVEATALLAVAYAQADAGEAAGRTVVQDAPPPAVPIAAVAPEPAAVVPTAPRSEPVRAQAPARPAQTPAQAQAAAKARDQEWLRRLAAELEAELGALPEAAAPSTAVAADAGPDLAAPAEQWFINLIAVSRESAALDLQRSYRAKGVETEVASVGRSLFGVRVGGFPTRPEAAARAAELKDILGIREVWIARQ